MNRPDIICIGAVHWDLIGHFSGRMPHGGDEPGVIRRSPGGVAFNVARALAMHGLRIRLIGATGSDAASDELVAAVARTGVEPALLRLSGAAGSYLAIEDEGGLVAAIAQSRTLEAAGLAILDGLADWHGPVFAETNLAGPVLGGLMALPGISDLRLAPAGPGKAIRLLPHLGDSRATFYLNRTEAELLAARPLDDAVQAAHALSRLGVDRAVVTDGARAAAEIRTGNVVSALPRPAPALSRVTGAGDAFLAAHVAAELLGNSDPLSAALSAAASHIQEILP